MCSKNNFFRLKKNGEKIQRERLIYSPSSRSVFYYVCKVFGNNNQGLCTTGFRDWKNVTSRLASHKTSLLHRTSVSQLSKIAGRIDSQMEQENQNERAYWRDIIVCVVEVLKFIAQQGLGIFGNNKTFGSEQNSNFLGLLELISKFDPFLAGHIGKHVIKGKSHVNCPLRLW
ncbi:uncharacterized protein LOC136083324 [Hydra vulgaris]|uniref:Uncharacterized protein LOC136083324 n=1 Tax=Hydra vulgaris TaxID=6087 RepID=A0ABM4CAW1_HYDVU